MRNIKFGWLNLGIASTLLIIIISLAFTYHGEYRWVGHAVVSIVGLITLGGMVTTGTKLAGRSGTSKAGLFRQHRKLSIFFTILIVSTFFYGMSVSLGKKEPLWSNTPHAWLGLAIIIVALGQLISSLIIKRTTTIRYIHRVIGYLLAALVLSQVILGVYMVLTGS